MSGKIVTKMSKYQNVSGYLQRLFVREVSQFKTGVHIYIYTKQRKSNLNNLETVGSVSLLLCITAQHYPEDRRPGCPGRAGGPGHCLISTILASVS